MKGKEGSQELFRMEDERDGENLRGRVTEWKRIVKEGIEGT